MNIAQRFMNPFASGAAQVTSKLSISGEVVAGEGVDLTFHLPGQKQGEDLEFFACHLDEDGCLAIAGACLAFLRIEHPGALEMLAELAAEGTQWHASQLEAQERNWRGGFISGWSHGMFVGSDLAPRGAISAEAIEDADSFAANGALRAWADAPNPNQNEDPPTYRPFAAVNEAQKS